MLLATLRLPRIATHIGNQIGIGRVRVVILPVVLIHLLLCGHVVIRDGCRLGRERPNGIARTGSQGERHGAVILVHRVVRRG